MSTVEPRTFQLHNTVSGRLEKFEPIEPGVIRLYTCGPTVYNYAHIGNLRTYVSEDVIRRAFEAGGYQVRHVMNVTDVGHLESDADQGDDKMSLAAARERKSPWDIARYYEEAFFFDCQKLHLLRPTVICRATEHIEHMQSMVKRLEERGFAYVAEGNVYFDIARFPEYGRMARLRLDDLEAGSRVELDACKRNPHDFVLWFSRSKFPNQIMQWDSPWGRGFPGWHIECSAMATEYLGERIDIHMGGIDHIPVHHTNEIAQSEAALGHPWVNVWMHCNFLVIDKAKMAKSADNFLRLQTIEDKGFDPVHYRYFCLGAHYRSELKFTWENLEQARRSFETLKNLVVGWKIESKKLGAKAKKSANSPDSANELCARYRERFWEALSDDINVSRALGVVWDMARDAELSKPQRLAVMCDFDRVLGLGVEQFQRPHIAPEMMAKVREREEARAAKDWRRADTIRDELAGHGIQLMDTPEGTDWYQEHHLNR
jgi:cysteinyl-tRNA synthetase